LVLHGEQEFEYHRPIVAGAVLRSEGKVVDAYEKESKGKTMTFVVSETVWSDDRTGDPVLTSRFNLIHRRCGRCWSLRGRGRALSSLPLAMTPPDPNGS